MLKHRGKQSTDSKQAGFIHGSPAVLRAEISETFCITTNLTRYIKKILHDGNQSTDNRISSMSNT